MYFANNSYNENRRANTSFISDPAFKTFSLQVMLFEESKGDTWLLQSFNASRNFEVLWNTRGEGDISLFFTLKS